MKKLKGLEAWLPYDVPVNYCACCNEITLGFFAGHNCGGFVDLGTLESNYVEFLEYQLRIADITIEYLDGQIK